MESHDLHLSREQVRSVDQRAIQEYGMTGLVLMENAGRGCADVLCDLGIAGPVVICCGKGNNGGDGFVIARHLEARGHNVRVLLFCDPHDLSGDAATNYAILEAARLPIHQYPSNNITGWLDEQLADADRIVDALLGTGSRGEPRPPLVDVIAQLNRHSAKKLAVDLPSGLDRDTGKCAATSFRADHTCTFVAAKTGFQTPEAIRVLGAVHTLGIGVPRKLMNEVASTMS